jgi:hypothetical protein
VKPDAIVDRLIETVAEGEAHGGLAAETARAFKT